MSHLRVPALLVAGAIASLAFTSSASAAYDDDTMVVKFTSGASAAQKRAALSVPGVGKSLGTVGGIGANVVSISRDAARLSTTLSRLPGVAYAEPNYILSTSATPNDPLFVDEYGLHNTGQTGGRSDADIDAPEGWDAAGLAGFPNSGGTRVGIVDTGIDRNHPDLAGKTVACATSYTAGTSLQNGQCPDDNGHGSHVAGTIAANTNNAQGVAGVAPNSALVVCKALATAAGVGLTTDIANCINWTANQNVRVISMSLGGGDNATLKAAVQAANNRGVLLVAAAGNDGDDTANYPAAYPEVMSVAATTDRDERASFSNANADVEIAAPGDAILSTYTAGLYFTASGTSMAAPHVAGVASVLFWRNPGASASSVRSTLTSTVDDLGPAGRDPAFGFGRVNLCKAAGGACAYSPGS